MRSSPGPRRSRRERYSPARYERGESGAATGTIGVACAQAGLEYVGIEVDETYFEVALRRLRSGL